MNRRSRAPAPVISVASAPVIIAEYDPDWPKRFEIERNRLQDAIGWVLETVEHIGSTAVPGMAAKPTIDMMGALRTLDDAAECIGPLAALGYDYVSEFEKLLPMRRFYRRVENGIATHHLHLVERESDFWREHFVFRDWLRSHPETAQEYAALKRELAQRFHHDREAYTNAKAPFIRRVLNEVRKEERVFRGSLNSEA